jgi:uncharacterized protein YceK
MKTIASILSLAGLLVISGCTTVEQREPATHTTSTTTEETSIVRPLPSTVETRTIRNY